MNIVMVNGIVNLRRKKMKLPNIYELLIMSQTDLILNLIEHIDLHTATSKYLLYRKTNEPKPLLCVHLDTINTMSRLDEVMTMNDLYLDMDRTIHLGTNSKMRCLGADDRAGVWIALQLIEYMEHTKDFKYDIGFFTDEEVGGLGSEAYRLDYPVDNNTCYIGLDRRNAMPNVHEVALYGYDNEELTYTFNDLGYNTVNGSFTDASNIAGDKACINLSVGYNHEHSKSETLHIPSMEYTLDTLLNMELPHKLYACDSRGYEYSYEVEDDSWELEILYDENKAMRAYIKSLGEDPEDIINYYFYE